MKKFTGLFILFLSVQVVISQPITEREVDDLVAKTLETFDVPGIALGIIQHGEPVLMKGYGVRSLDSKIPMDENTLFGIASNSKAFTSAALGILVQQGKIAWDDRVIDYIPEFRLYDPYVTHDFRIRDLLCHRSGMGLGAGDLMIWPDGTDFTREDVIHNLRYLQQVSAFRTKYDYDNLLYIVAGEVIGKVSGTSWEAFIEQEIMQPLDMTSSAASFKRLKDQSNVIDPHAPVDGKVQVVSRTTNELMNAAGGIYSSVADMAKWASYLIKESKNEDDRTLLEASTIQELWSPQTIIPVRGPGAYKTHFASYGLGFRLADEMGYKAVSHTGGLAGIVTIMTLIPELDLAIIVFTNQQSGAAFSAITNTIKDAYYGTEKRDWVKIYSENTTGAQENANKILTEVSQSLSPTVPESLIKTITGVYQDPWLGKVKIYQKDAGFYFLSSRSPGLDGQLYHLKSNTFVVKWKDRSMDADAYLLLELDYNGNPSGFTMKAISPLTDFSFDFHDLRFTKIE